MTRGRTRGPGAPVFFLIFFSYFPPIAFHLLPNYVFSFLFSTCCLSFVLRLLKVNHRRRKKARASGLQPSGSQIRAPHSCWGPWSCDACHTAAGRQEQKKTAQHPCRSLRQPSPHFQVAAKFNTWLTACGLFVLPLCLRFLADVTLSPSSLTPH